MKETTKFWREPSLGDLELLRATYITHSFAPHVHAGYAIGVIDQGAETFRYRGATHVAAAGCVVVINPDELHTGQAVTPEGWTYRMLYPAASLVQQAASAVADRPHAQPFFPDPVLPDPDLADRLRRLHTSLETVASPLERESRLLDFFAHLVRRYAADPPAIPHLPPEREAVRRARAYLDDHIAQPITLDHLAHHVGLSPFHLLRVFRAEAGLTPHAYLTHTRIQYAKSLLARGAPIADVAVQAGFVDQSHLTRHFKRVVGVPPGQYKTES